MAQTMQGPLSYAEDIIEIAGVHLAYVHHNSGVKRDKVYPIDNCKTAGSWLTSILR
jgi:hypothetical protein